MHASMPIAAATSLTAAPDTSHSALMLSIDDTRCARNAFATSFDSSAVQPAQIRRDFASDDYEALPEGADLDECVEICGSALEAAKGARSSFDH